MPEYPDKAARLAQCRRKFAMCNARAREHQQDYNATGNRRYLVLLKENEEDAEYWKAEMAKVTP